MALHVSLTRPGRYTADVYQQLREAILDGRLRSGDGLPSTRELARQLDVSRNTVSYAYQQLVAEGFLVGRVGAGTFVTSPPELAPRRLVRVYRERRGALIEALERHLGDHSVALPSSAGLHTSV